MASAFEEIIKRHARPLEPRPTGVSPALSVQEGVRAVLFDVYGTLLISGSGDVGLHAAEDRSAAFAATCRAVWEEEIDGVAGVAAFKEAITREHAAAKARGVDSPEIDVREIWRAVKSSVPLPVVSGVDDRLNAEAAVEYEMRTNPTWEMPHAAGVLRDLRSRGLLLGIVSNAQFFTPHLFPPLLGDSLDGFGFAPGVRSWSYEHRRAKPGTFLYEHAADRLKEHGIAPGEVLYVGNDLLNDCTPAQTVGFRTALFAGDARSLRMRGGDDRVKDTVPTVTVTDLRQIVDCLPARG